MTAPDATVSFDCSSCSSWAGGSCCGSSEWWWLLVAATDSDGQKKEGFMYRTVKIVILTYCILLSFPREYKQSTAWTMLFVNSILITQNVAHVYFSDEEQPSHLESVIETIKSFVGKQTYTGKRSPKTNYMSYRAENSKRFFFFFKGEYLDLYFRRFSANSYRLSMEKNENDFFQIMEAIQSVYFDAVIPNMDKTKYKPFISRSQNNNKIYIQMKPNQFTKWTIGGKHATYSTDHIWNLFGDDETSGESKLVTCRSFQFDFNRLTTFGDGLFFFPDIFFIDISKNRGGISKNLDLVVSWCGMESEEEVEEEVEEEEVEEGSEEEKKEDEGNNDNDSNDGDNNEVVVRSGMKRKAFTIPAFTIPTKIGKQCD
jgi:hypothetical protein